MEDFYFLHYLLVVTELDDRRIMVRFLTGARDFPFPERQERLWDPPGYLMGTSGDGACPGGEGTGGM
jgi:hypothetical protein